MNTKLDHVQGWEGLAQAAWSIEKIAFLCKVSSRTLDRYFIKVKCSPNMSLAGLRQRRVVEKLGSGASNIFSVNWKGPPDHVSRHDPLFNIQIDCLVWIFGRTAAVVALVYPFIERFTLTACLAPTLAICYLFCRVCLLTDGGLGLVGYLRGLPHIFINFAGAGRLVVDIPFLYPLAGNGIALNFGRRLAPPTQAKKGRSRP